MQEAVNSISPWEMNRNLGKGNILFSYSYSFVLIVLITMDIYFFYCNKICIT